MEHDAIRKAIEARRRPGAVLQRIGGLKQLASMFVGGGLPRPLRALIEETYVEDEFSRRSHVDQKRGVLGNALVGLSDADWRRSVQTLLPQIGPSAVAACEAVTKRPYQDGLTRKPFRSPSSPLAVAEVRGRWLVRTTLLLGEYEGDIGWVAEHAAHLSGWWGGAELGWLLAGALDVGGDTAAQVEEILTASARGDHPTAQFGRHVTQAFMSCSRESAWEYVEKLLLAAQRQEGLRQVILESVDESHPGAFRRMLRLILEEDLTRFSSVVRAADTWFGLMWDGSSGVAIDSILRRVLGFLEDPDARTAAFDEKDAETVYLALWSTAFEDVDRAIAPASALLASSSVEVRFVATHFLAQTIWTTSVEPLARQLLDADPRVAARALDVFDVDQTSVVDGELLFHNLEQLMARTTKRSVALDALVWPWWKRKLERTTIASALAANVSAVKGERLLPYIPDMAPHQRAAFLRSTAGLPHRWQLSRVEAKPRKLSPAERTVVLELLGDSSEDTRAAAFEVARTFELREDEVSRLVDLLARKPADLRTSAIARLRTLGDAALLRVADRLIDDDEELRRLAGLELLRDAVESDRAAAAARERAARYAQEHPTPSDEERAHLDAMLGESTDAASRSDALGLVDRAALRTWPRPRSRKTSLATAGARASLDSLAELVLAHHTTEVRTASGETKLLVESVWSFGPRTREDATKPDPAVPLLDVWRTWVKQRDAALRDADGLELLRALLSERPALKSESDAVRRLDGIAQYSAGMRFLMELLEWCVVWEPPAGAPDFLLNGLEDTIASLSDADYREMEEKRGRWNGNHYYYGEETPSYQLKLVRAEGWLHRFRWWRELFPGSVGSQHAERLYGLLRAFEERSRGFGMLRITLDDFIPVYRSGVVGEADFLDLLVGPWSVQTRNSVLRDASARKPPRALADAPELLALVDRARRRIVDVESKRGDRVTEASALTTELRTTGGLETLMRALPALGKTHFARHFGWSSDRSRQETLSHLVVRSLPREEDTPEAFAQWVRQTKLREARLVELAVYAPQWASHVNHVLGWPGLEGGVWWIEAHTKDDRSWQLQEMKEIWAGEVSERTALSASDLTEGAVDVAWFAEVHGQLGAERWKALDTAAKYAASSAGHTRAQLFARAMSGLVTRDELLERIASSRHQDSVRALGLLPLAEGEESRRRDLLERYERLEAFRRESRKFGSQRQQSEGRAIAIAMANLARTAGFRDPQRLQWAMEREALGALVRGPIVVTRGDVELTLSIDEAGVPSLAVTKKGKPLKTLPATLKKDAEVEELKQRYSGLKRQRSRVRDALEGAMCRGDRFASGELADLLTHPILAPSVAGLVFVGDGIAGYPVEGGRALRDHAGQLHAVGDAEELRIAHPVDLFERGDWSAWQRECFLAERVQPFKQLFRELYPRTAAERGTARTRRYAGHQVNPKQALALLGTRSWIARPEEGVSRTFHEAGITARLGFQEAFYTAADVEGLTLEEVVFTKKGEWKELPLDEIPGVVFSEAMRDLDLAVSVAHRGGVDPEATASTVEMRAALLRETCELLGLSNVEVQANHAIIRGTLGEYSVHLGSAGVMLLPGTFLPIVAVHSQHRGRLFLPFADDDPRTAEVMSKVLLLARDREIRDPNILDWIRAGHGSFDKS